MGTALGLRAQSLDSRVVVLMGDGELDEGTNAEAIAVAGALELHRLTVVLVDNHSASLGWSGGLERRFDVEGWATRRVDGHDHAALATVLGPTDAASPTLVVAEVEASA